MRCHSHDFSPDREQAITLLRDLAESALAAVGVSRNRKGPDVGRALNYLLLLSSHGLMRTLEQADGSCQIQIFTAMYLFLLLSRI